MSKLAEAIANTVKAAQDQDWTKLGTSIVDIVESGVSVLGKISVSNTRLGIGQSECSGLFLCHFICTYFSKKRLLINRRFEYEIQKYII